MRAVAVGAVALLAAFVGAALRGVVIGPPRIVHRPVSSAPPRKEATLSTRSHCGPARWCRRRHRRAHTDAGGHRRRRDRDRSSNPTDPCGASAAQGGRAGTSGRTRPAGPVDSRRADATAGHRPTRCARPGIGARRNFASTVHRTDRGRSFADALTALPGDPRSPSHRPRRRDRRRATGTASHSAPSSISSPPRHARPAGASTRPTPENSRFDCRSHWSCAPCPPSSSSRSLPQ